MKTGMDIDMMFTKSGGKYYAHKDAEEFGDPLPGLFDDLVYALACSYLLITSPARIQFMISSYALAKSSDNPYTIAPIPGGNGALIAQFNCACFIMEMKKLEWILNDLEPGKWRERLTASITKIRSEMSLAALEALRRSLT